MCSCANASCIQKWIQKHEEFIIGDNIVKGTGGIIIINEIEEDDDAPDTLSLSNLKIPYATITSPFPINLESVVTERGNVSHVKVLRKFHAGLPIGYPGIENINVRDFFLHPHLKTVLICEVLTHEFMKKSYENTDWFMALRILDFKYHDRLPKRVLDDLKLYPLYEIEGHPWMVEVETILENVFDFLFQSTKLYKEVDLIRAGAGSCRVVNGYYESLQMRRVKFGLERDETELDKFCKMRIKKRS